MTCVAPELRPSSSSSSGPTGPDSYDAIVLAGAGSRRMSGRDKAEVLVGGRRLIDRALEAVSGADRIVVVGPPRPVVYAVEWTSESPPGGGPAAALKAGIRCVSSEIVVLLAVDLPFLGAPLVARLVRELAHDTGTALPPEGVILCDASGRDQPLAGAYLARRLRALLEPYGALAGVSLKAVLGPLRLKRVTEAEATLDCDTWADVEAAEAKLESRR
ncbi:MAG: NTP transferase domain-containing protein [Actinomycetota bacterium]|nr:NTP transferase domain-containing protein [Actinomycetota bacterium]